MHGTKAQAFAKRQRWKCTRCQRVRHLVNNSPTTKPVCKDIQTLQLSHLCHRNQLLFLALSPTNSKGLYLKANSPSLHKSASVPYIALNSRNETMILLVSQVQNACDPSLCPSSTTGSLIRALWRIWSFFLPVTLINPVQPSIT